jgi:hypothetical protein
MSQFQVPTGGKQSRCSYSEFRLNESYGKTGDRRQETGDRRNKEHALHWCSCVSVILSSVSCLLSSDFKDVFIRNLLYTYSELFLRLSPAAYISVKTRIKLVGVDHLQMNHVVLGEDRVIMVRSNVRVARVQSKSSRHT